jgi:class 3 adenylate cyclase
MKRKIAAILAADVAGYSRLVAEDEEDTLRRLASYREVFDDFVKRYGGRIFNTAGDSVMCEFDSAVEAVRAAIDIQESLRTRNLACQPSRRLQFRIGITIGDVVERGDDLLGDGVNIAARLESLAEPGGICVSRSVHEAVANKVSVPFRDIGQRTVKNIPQPVHAFAVAWPGEIHDVSADAPRHLSAERVQAPTQRPRGMRLPWLTWLGGAALVAAGLALVVLRSEPPEGPAEEASLPATAPLPPPRASASAPSNAADALTRLARQGGILPEAKTAPELYHNARLFEARGDAAAARRAYQTLAAMGLELVDPHLRYSALLRAQDGRAGAREVYSELLSSAPARIVSFIHAQQFEGAERRAKIETLAAAHPDFPPAHYFLAEEYSEDRLGNQTLTERRLEYESLERFLEAESEGRLAPLFLDHSVLAQWLDRARKRKAASEAFFRTATTRPTASFMRSNTGWTASLSIPEAANSISYRVGESGDFKSTGTSSAIDPRTGRAVPMPSFELPGDQGATPVYVMYDDARGHTAGPFIINFDPKLALPAGQRDILERVSSGWVSFHPEGELLYYTSLVSYRCAIERAVMGFDGGPLDTLLPLPPCDERNPHAIPPDTTPYVSVPKTVKAVSVQLTYFDGSQSEVRTFRR